MKNNYKYIQSYFSFLNILLLVSLILAIIARLYNLDSPLLGRYEFRQTQTAYTVRYFVELGVNMLDYVTPVLGEEARIPFEFPIFQLSAYIVYKLCCGFVSIDYACRLSNVIWFFLSAYTTMKMAEYVFDNINIGKTACIIYMLLPYNIYWSRTSMIDYCSAFFAMAYACLFVKWLKDESISVYLLLNAFGSLAYLSKVTSVVVVMPVIMFFFYKKIMDIKDKTRIDVIQWMKFIIPLIFPLVLGGVWAKYTDMVKIQSGFFALTSSGLSKWNFGTFEQRCNIETWERIFRWTREMMLPGLWIMLPVSMFFINDRKYLLKCVLAFSGVMIPVFTFFNLYYVHEYYYIAISPMLAVGEAACLYYILKDLGYIKKVIMILLLCASIGAVSNDFKQAMINDVNGYNDHYYWKLSEFVKENTSSADRILILDNDWNPALQYYTFRNGATIKNEWFGALKNKEFDYVFYKNKDNPVLMSINNIEIVAGYDGWILSKIVK